MCSGTHWVSEILHMLVRGSPTYAERSKESEMVELNDDLDSLAQLPSPRILNSHNYIAQLPCEILEKRVKVKKDFLKTLLSIFKVITFFFATDCELWICVYEAIYDCRI